MPNTGKKIILTLKRIQNPGAIDTGEKKNNTLGDTHYLPPVVDLDACPVTYLLDCANVRYTHVGTTLRYEFNLANSTVDNPALKKIRVVISGGSAPHTFVLPNTPSKNYFTGTFEGLDGATTYTLSLEYIDNSEQVLKTCPVA